MIFYIIPEIRYAIGLAELSPEPMTIITGDWHLAVDYLREQKIEVWCAEESRKETSYHAPGLLRLSAVQKLIEACPAKKRKLLTFKVSPPFTALAEKLTAEVLMPPYKLNRFWEDKSRAGEALAEEKVPVKNSVTATWRSLTYAKASKALKAKKLVIQKPHGMAGNSTFFVNNEKEWGKLRSVIGTNPLVKVSPFVPGDTYTVNCLISKSGKVVSSFPMLQITGDERFTRYPGGTCGLDMTGAQKWKKPVLTKLNKIVEASAKAMHKTGFWGWFGIDFVLDEKDQITVLEVNPRFTASISIFTQAQQLQFKNSFWVEYLSEKSKKTDWQQPLPYTSLLLRNISDENQTITPKFKPGIYTWTTKGLALQKETVLVKDLQAKNEYLIVAKAKGCVIHPDGEMATIVVNKSATKKGEVEAELAKVALAVKEMLLAVV